MKKAWIVWVVIFFASAAWAKEVKEAKEDILAKVDGRSITVQEYKKAFDQLPPQVQWAVRADKNLQVKFLDNLITKVILLEAAEKSGIKEDEEMKRKIQEYKESLLLNKYLDMKLKDINVSETEAKDYYERHKEEFTSPKKVRARHILVRTEEEAEKIQERLKKGENFAELAKKYSIDHTTAARGGELGFFSYKEMVKPFSEVAFSLKPGEISPIVKTPFGFHIIQVEEVKPARQKSYEEVKDQIKGKLLREKQQKAFDELVANLKKEHKVETHPELLQRIFSGNNK